MTQEEYSKMLAEARDQFKSGVPLFGKDGAFHRVLEDFLNAALEGEKVYHIKLLNNCGGVKFVLKIYQILR